MLNKTLEFLRIADMTPSHEKVGKRSNAAKIIVDAFLKTKDQDLLLPCIQGVVVGFDCVHFKQGSAVVDAVYAPIKELDNTLPSDLKDNAMELRAVAAIAVGELLSTHAATRGAPSEKARLTATAFVSAVASRPAVTEKHLKWILETLLAASNGLLLLQGKERRSRETIALTALKDIEEPEGEDVNTWQEVMKIVSPVIQEIHHNDEINREELETLWWLFADYSDIENKAFDQLSVAAAALSAGIELAERSLLPPPRSAAGMIKRATENRRKAEDLVPLKLQDLAGGWSAAMSGRFNSSGISADNLVVPYPVLLPVTTTCALLAKDGKTTKTLKDARDLTLLSGTYQLTPTEWGQQIFREKILQRMLAGLGQ